MFKEELLSLLYHSTEVALLKLYPVLSLQCDLFHLITKELILREI